MIDWEPSAHELSQARSAEERPASTSERPSAFGDLRPIPFTAFAVTELPEIWESDTEFAWQEFDAATRSMDLATQSGRDEYDELMAAQTDRRPRA